MSWLANHVLLLLHAGLDQLTKGPFFSTMSPAIFGPLWAAVKGKTAQRRSLGHPNIPTHHFSSSYTWLKYSLQCFCRYLRSGLGSFGAKTDFSPRGLCRSSGATEISSYSSQVLEFCTCRWNKGCAGKFIPGGSWSRQRCRPRRSTLVLDDVTGVGVMLKLWYFRHEPILYFR